MKVHTIAKQSPAAVIAETASTQIRSEAPATMPHSDKMAGMLLAQETVALAIGQSKPWHTIIVRIIEATQEVRASYILAVRDQLKNMREANKESGLDDKVVAKQIRTATVMVSNCASVARAFNGGATIRGFVEWVRKNGGKGLTLDTWREAGYTLFIDYAKTFGKTTAGRPRATLLQRLGRLIEQAADQEMTGEEKKVYKDLKAFYATEVEAHPALVPAEE